jgi:DivIVA domain-containing protein
MLEGAIIMYEEKIFLTANDILEKDFKIDARGYRPQEVDKFLDLIIRDYSEFSTIIKRLENEVKSLESENLRTDRNCHFGFFAVSGQNSVFPPNYDCFRTPNN